MRKVFSLTLLPWLLCFALPAFGEQDRSSAVKSRAQSETAFEEQLWAAQKTLEAGNLEEAEKLYRSILGKSKRNPRALLGLARVFQKMARRDGKYPSGFGELMNQMKDCIDEQGKEVAAIQERLRDNGSRNDNSQMMKPQL